MKTMKFTLLVVSFSAFILAGCTKKDGTGTLPGKNPPIVLDCDYFNEDRVLLDDPDADVDYVIACRMKVQADIKIEPGVVIEFQQGAGINVYPDGAPKASLSAVGTSAKPIIFRGVNKQKGFWAGIRFYQSEDTKNELTHVKIQDAGNSYWGAEHSGGVMAGGGRGSLKIMNTTISNCLHYGLNINDGKQNLAFSNNIITQNDYPIKTHPNHIIVFDATSKYAGNSNDFLFVNSYGTGIDRSGTWHKIDVPYKLKADFSAGHGGLGVFSNLVIQAGVEIVMTPKSMISVGDLGSLAMNGTANDRIIVRGEQDVPGYWEAIRFRSGKNPLNKMTYVDIKNGGKTVWNPTHDPNGALTLDDSFLIADHVAFIKCFDFGINVRSSNFTHTNLSFAETPRTIGDWHNQ